MLGRRGLSFGQLLLATGLGVAGGIYIYQPIFQGGPRAGGPAGDTSPPPPRQEEKPPPGTRLG